MAVFVAEAAGNVAAGTVAAVRSPARVVVQMKRRIESYNNAYLFYGSIQCDACPLFAFK